MKNSLSSFVKKNQENICAKTSCIIQENVPPSDIKYEEVSECKLEKLTCSAMGWIRTSLFLCVFGFLKESRPSEPFVVEYLTGPWKNFTEAEVLQEMFPLGTYSYVATLLPVLLLTDFLRYKPIIILCGLSGSCVYIIMIEAQRLWEMKIVQTFYGLFSSTEVAYFAYIYAKVDKKHFHTVTSHTRVALLLGRFVASVVSQLATSLNLLDYHLLNYLSLSGIGLSTMWAFFLPSVGQSIYFHRQTNPISNDQSSPSKLQIATIKLNQSTSRLYYSHENMETKDNRKSPFMTTKIVNAYHLLWKDFLLAYSNCYVLKWSVWWVLASCGYMQVLNYAQVLWQNSYGKADSNYNAAVEAGHTVLGALATFAIGKLRLNWAKIGDVTSSIFAIIQSILLLVAAKTYNIWLSYAAYIGFGVIYQAMMTVTTAEVAKNISEDSHGLIFGTNTLMALLLQSALTFAVSGSQGFALSIRTQYVIYGGYFIALGTLFMVMTVYTCKTLPE